MVSASSWSGLNPASWRSALIHRNPCTPKQRDAEADTSALEREIDELVYALYGLTADEIKIIKEAAG
jgi:hypothetical protein